MKTRWHCVWIALFVSGCGGASLAAPARSPEAPAHEAGPAEAPSAEDQKASLLRADHLGKEALAAGNRDARFAMDRQIGALREAIALYRQFIDRAGSDPGFADEVRRSRERIDEANATIAFLLAQPADAVP